MKEFKFSNCKQSVFNRHGVRFNDLQFIQLMEIKYSALEKKVLTKDETQVGANSSAAYDDYLKYLEEITGLAQLNEAK
jgi:hypothetical protein